VTGDNRSTATGAPLAGGERFVTIARCPTAGVADFVRSLLDQAGIESVLQDQYLSQLFAFFSGPIGGVRVQVRLRDVPAALEILRRPPQPLPAEMDVGPDAGAEGAGAFALRCPQCGSDSISFVPAEPEGFLIRWLELVIPLPFLHGHWECGACGKRWLELTGPRG
jgi:hypothetical protein